MPFGIAAAAIGSAVASAGAAIAAISVTTALEVVTAVGVGLSVIGTVTHNQTLSEVGMALGVVGGVGSLAAGAGLLGADASTSGSLFGTEAASSVSDASDAAAGATDAADAASGFGVTSDATAGASAGDITISGSQAAAPLDIVDSFGGVNAASALPQTATEAQLGAATGTGSDLISAPNSLLGSTLGGAPTAEQASGAITTANALPPMPSPTPLASGPTAPVTPVTPATPAPAAPSAPGTPTSDLAAILKSNSQDNLKTAAIMGGLQAGGSFLTGAFSTLTPAQIAQLNSQAAQNNAAAGLTALQTQNMSQPLPVASRGSNAAGLINTYNPALYGLPA
jgi:trimeric autotransporter adhesin